MKIGIDIDGVIFKTNKTTKLFCGLYDLLFLKLVPHKTDEQATEKRYIWIKKHFGSLEKTFLKPLTKTQQINNGAKTMISLLRHDNNKIYAISTRGTSKLRGGEELTEIARKSLNAQNLIFDEYLWGHINKSKICKEVGIEIMLEDSYETCKNLAKKDIHSIYFVNILPKNPIPSNHIHPVTNCIDAYFEIQKIKKEVKKENAIKPEYKIETEEQER